MHENGVASVEARVRHVDGEAEGGSKSLRARPCLVPRTARRIAGQIAGNDLGAPLVVQLRHAGRLDGHHGRVGREFGHLGRAQVQELRVYLGHLEVGAQFRPPASFRPRASSPGSPATVWTATRPLDARARPCRPGRSAVAAHRRIGPDQLGHAVEGVALGVDDVAVLGGVPEDGRAGGAQLREPLALHRPDELDEHERLTTLGRVLVGQRRSLRRVHLTAGQQHLAHVVAAVGTGAAGARRRRRWPRPARMRRSALPRARRPLERAVRGQNRAPRAGARTCQGAIRRPRDAPATRPPRAAAARAR